MYVCIRDIHVSITYFGSYVLHDDKQRHAWSIHYYKNACIAHVMYSFCRDLKKLQVFIMKSEMRMIQIAAMINLTLILLYLPPGSASGQKVDIKVLQGNKGHYYLWVQNSWIILGRGSDAWYQVVFIVRLW